LCAPGGRTWDKLTLIVTFISNFNGLRMPTVLRTLILYRKKKKLNVIKFYVKCLLTRRSAICEREYAQH